jgi:hypothetical protein
MNWRDSMLVVKNNRWVSSVRVETGSRSVKSPTKERAVIRLCYLVCS